ncbi:MAG: translation initiation factor IF-6 [Sulfolobaceae archaeon]|nr:translation initiation factor IF-6 [Sulfolobaceae archaeon]
MNIQKLTVFGNDNIGVYIFTNDKYTIIPKGLSEHSIKLIEETLKTEVIVSEIARTSLIGVFINGNNNVILLPRIASDDEIRTIKESAKDCRVEVLDIRPTALGNIFLLNDNAALIYTDLTDEEEQKVRNVLEMDNVKRGMIANILTVGSAGVVTDKGGLIHVEAKDEEVNELSKFFKVNIDIGTVNFGNPFIRSGLIANVKGILVGSSTTGPEILRIQKAFGE